MKIGETLKLYSDDNFIDVVDKINAALEEHGLRFEADDQPHDGFEILTLRKLPPRDMGSS